MPRPLPSPPPRSKRNADSSPSRAAVRHLRETACGLPPTRRNLRCLLPCCAARNGAARLPLDLIARDNAEGAALLAVADAIEHAALPAGNLGLLIEYFRGSWHER